MRDNASGTVHDEKYNPDYLVPDRMTGLTEVEELRRVCPGRTWNFVRLRCGRRMKNPLSRYYAG